MARKTTALHETELRKLGIAYKRARFFITCKGKYAGIGIHFDRASIRSQLAKPIDGGSHGRRCGTVLPGQMSLFDADHNTTHHLRSHTSRASHSLEETSHVPTLSIKQPDLHAQGWIKTSAHTHMHESNMQPVLHTAGNAS